MKKRIAEWLILVFALTLASPVTRAQINNVGDAPHITGGLSSAKTASAVLAVTGVVLVTAYSVHYFVHHHRHHAAATAAEKPATANPSPAIPPRPSCEGPMDLWARTVCARKTKD